MRETLVALSPGDRLGPYEIVAPLGVGGMGEVYRAKDTKLNREVAVKVLPSHLSSSEEMRQRFEREAKAISASFERSSRPSGPRIPGPNRSTSFSYASGERSSTNAVTSAGVGGRPVKSVSDRGAKLGSGAGSAPAWRMPA